MAGWQRPEASNKAVSILKEKGVGQVMVFKIEM